MVLGYLFCLFDLFGVFFQRSLSTAKSIHCDFIWCVYPYIGSKKNVSSHPESQHWSIQSEIYGILKKILMSWIMIFIFNTFCFLFLRSSRFCQSLTSQKKNKCLWEPGKSKGEFTKYIQIAILVGKPHTNNQFTILVKTLNMGFKLYFSRISLNSFFLFYVEFQWP